jgi:hypothetical protein
MIFYLHRKEIAYIFVNEIYWLEKDAKHLIKIIQKKAKVSIE